MRIRYVRALVVLALATVPVVTIGAPTALAGAAPTAILVTVDTEEEACRLAQLNLVTGEVTQFGPASLDHCAVDLAFAGDGSLYGAVPAEFFSPDAEQPEIEADAVKAFFGDVAAQDQVPWNLVRYDAETGDAQVVGELGTFEFSFNDFTFAGLTFDKDGNLFFTGIGDSADCPGADQFCLYSVNRSTAATTFIAAGPFQTFLSPLAGSCNGVATSVFSSEVATQTLAALNTATAVATPAPSSFVGTADSLIVNFDFDAGGALWGVGITDVEGEGSAEFHVFSIDPTTGVATAGANVGTDGLQPGLWGFAVEPMAQCAAEVVVIEPTFTG